MKYCNYIGRRRRFQGPVMSLAMVSMHPWIIQQRRWRLLAKWNFREQLSISFEQSVNGLGHLASNPTNHTGFSCVGLCSLVVRLFGFAEVLVAASPFIVSQADGLQNSK